MSALGPRRGGERVGPSRNRLVARRQDLDSAQRALSEARLLTFTGPGGVGKTRLALELAFRAADRFPDGAWLVRLGELGIGADVTDIEAAILNALGVSDQSATEPRQKLVTFLRDRKLLLVTDNCEHVLPALRVLLPLLLREAPQIRVIATSREPLGVEAEVLRPVLPLTVPESGTPAEQLIADGSVSLLMERVGAVDPDFDISDDNAVAVIELCRLLEGVPLAIELAAAKLRALTVEQLVQRFGQRITELAAAHDLQGSRHRSLRSMVDWSFELCTTTGQVLWRRMAVFPATFDLDLAESVCAFGELQPADVIDAIERLVGQSVLLTDRGAGTMRYRLPAAVREVAAELAENAGETTQLQRRHRDAMLERAERTVQRWCGPQQAVLIERMRLDHANYVAALQWSATTPGEERTALRLIAALRYHWMSGGHLAEGRMRAQTMLATTSETSPDRFDCLWVATWIALIQGDYGQAKQWLDELTALATELGIPGLERYVDHWTALLAMFTGDVDHALPLFERAVDRHRAAGDLEMELTARYMLVGELALAGRAEEALALSSDTVTLCDRHGEKNARAYSDWGAGVALWTLGKFDEAEQHARRVLTVDRTMSDGIGVALSTELLSWIARDRKQVARARTLSAAARHVWRSLGTSINAFGPQLSGFVEANALPPQGGTPEVDSEDVPRRFRDLDDVIDFVLGVAAGRRGVRSATMSLLTPRELEVAGLIESGLSNREIAQRLVISKRTADGHVERILAKLGFSSRAQVAAWMARRAS
ncbi:ATP-binding protein [Nocardia sp. CA-084685]|uniref:ATP-binding protein n=1 Tax=Nocardia sp. CA-084685 TaxID=3239970 RepID=UPI003D99668C